MLNVPVLAPEARLQSHLGRELLTPNTLGYISRAEMAKMQGRRGRSQHRENFDQTKSKCKREGDGYTAQRTRTEMAKGEGGSKAGRACKRRTMESMS